MKFKKQSLLIIPIIASSMGAGYLGSYFYDITSTPSEVEKITLEETNISNITEKVIDSVVEIQTQTESKDIFQNTSISTGAGSGVIIKYDKESNIGYIVTNYHVIENSKNITIKLHNGKSYEATVKGSSEEDDIAVLEIKSEEDLNTATYGTSKNLKIGSTTIVIGNPLGELGGTVSTGIISALDREINVEGNPMTLLQTDASVNPGNSGGGMFNANGELVGIINAKSGGTDVEGIGFAIPIDIAKPIIEDIIINGKVTNTTITLGVSLVNVENDYQKMQLQVNDNGVYIVQIEKDSIAEKSNLKLGDRILKINEKEITNSADVKRVMKNSKIGDKLTIVVIRDNKNETIEITL